MDSINSGLIFFCAFFKLLLLDPSGPHMQIEYYCQDYVHAPHDMHMSAGACRRLTLLIGPLAPPSFACTASHTTGVYC